MSRAIILLISIYSILELRSQWVLVPSGVTDSLTAITAIDGAFYVAGGGGVFLRSFDAGNGFSPTQGYGPPNCETWDPGEYCFKKLSFHDQLVGYGSDTRPGCSALITYNGGESWQSLPLGFQGTWLLIAIDDTAATAFKGGAALHFEYPSGLLLFEPHPIYADLSILCPEGNIMCDYILNSQLDTIMVSIGSYAWSLSSNDRISSIDHGAFTYSYYLRDAHVISRDTIIASDHNSRYLMTINNGLNWTPNMLFPNSWNGQSRTAMDWQSIDTGFVCTDLGTLFRTTNGQSWTQIPTPTTEHLNDIHFINDQQGWAVGENGTIIASIDGGQSWFLEESGVTEHLNAIASDDQAVIIIGHNGTLLRRDLTVSIPSGTTGSNTSISVLDREGNILVRSDTQIESVQLFDTMGRLLIGSTANGTSIQIQSPVKGISICRVQLSDGRFVDRRIFIP